MYITLALVVVYARKKFWINFSNSGLTDGTNSQFLQSAIWLSILNPKIVVCMFKRIKASKFFSLGGRAECVFIYSRFARLISLAISILRLISIEISRAEQNYMNIKISKILVIHWSDRAIFYFLYHLYKTAVHATTLLETFLKQF